MCDDNINNLKEQASEFQISDYYKNELYKKAWLENDTGISNEFCQNTTTWD